MKLLSSTLLLTLSFFITKQGVGQNDNAYQNLINHFHAYVDNNELAGTLIFLEKDGVLTKDVYGYQDKETKKKLSENSIFRLASMTKPLVATAILQLVEKGTLKLDDPVSNYIPEVANMRVYDGTAEGKRPLTPMTIRRLLSHTSGITSGFDFSAAGKAAGEVMARQKANSLEELVKQICNTQLAFDPGEGWAYGYSNDLLAYIIERLTGQTIDKYLEENILKPLDMRHTSFLVENADLLASVYATVPEGGIKAIETGENSKYTNGENMPRGNGGLAGTAGDYLHFCQMILHKGTYKGRKILDPSSVEIMKKNVVKDQFFPIKVAANEMIGQGYGLGFGVVMDQSPFGTKGDLYWPGALYTYFFISPENKAIGIFMTQLYDFNKMGMIWEFHDLATKALDGAE